MQPTAPFVFTDCLQNHYDLVQTLNPLRFTTSNRYFFTKTPSASTSTFPVNDFSLTCVSGACSSCPQLILSFAIDCAGDTPCQNSLKAFSDFDQTTKRVKFWADPNQKYMSFKL